MNVLVLPVSVFLFAVSSLIFTPLAQALSLNFDDLNASTGDIDLTGTNYQGYSWSNFSAYDTSNSFFGFSSGVVSGTNAAYTGGELINGSTISPVIGSLSSSGLFDVGDAYLAAGYYDGLDVTVEGLLNGSVLFSKTVTVSSTTAQLFAFNFTGINQLDFFALVTGNTSDPYSCGSFNCTQFTVDDLSVQANNGNTGGGTVPEPSSLLLLAAGLFGFRISQRVKFGNTLKRWRQLLFLLVISLTVPAIHAEVNPAADGVHEQLAKLSATQFAEPLYPTIATTADEDSDLLSAIQKYQTRGSEDDYSALTDYLAAHPASGWQTALLTNLGLSYYQAGRFSLAIDTWEKAWLFGKNVTEPQIKVLVDRALGELMRMHARVGHADRLEALFAEMGDRQVSGPATENVAGAREGLWQMRNNYGIAYLCGPMALKNLLLSQGMTPKQVEFLDNYRSGTHGVSLTKVGKLAKQAKIPYSLIKRLPGEPIPVPSVVHWNVSHYAAILEERQGRYHIQDPIFGQDLWVTRDAIDQEASGHYLVPTNKLEAGWHKIQLAEADKLYGMGYTGNNDPNQVGSQGDPTKPGKCNGGMCDYNFSEMAVSLNFSDIPVGYRPPKGPEVFTTLTYNQRDADQPANFSFFNVSQKWSLNWLTYIQDNPTSPGASVSRYAAGGGSYDYSGYNSTTHQFTPETKNQAVLVLVSSSPIRYERRLPNGSVEVYGQSNGSTTSTRLVFLTQIVDPSGNALTLNYDNQLRLSSVTDATGRDTTFSYDLSNRPLLVTKITDPFGRSASMTYDSSGRLTSIKDVFGLTSGFHYDSASLIDSMTTPYGTTTFAYGGSGSSRYLQATDPLGNTERLEFQQGISSIPFNDPTSTVPQGIIAPFNSYINGRNTYYWDKHAYKIAAGDYTKARIKHWTHCAQNTGVTCQPVESIKYPLENRIWFNYPGQPNGGLGTAVSGTYDQPTRQGRVLDDGTTQLLQTSYNGLGQVTERIDALGRDTKITYAANQIDPIQIDQKTAANTFTTIAKFTYNSQHLPLTSTDAAGQTTSYSYNSAGQLIEVKDPLGQITSYSYDNLGYPAQVTNANGKTQLSLTYDTYGRVETRTDSEGYTLAYSYDDFDRLSKITYPDGTSQTTTWDKLDKASVTDREGRTTHYSYDAVRNLIAETDPLGHKTQYTYYPNQYLKSLTDGNDKVTSWNRDIQSRVTAKTYADGKQTTYAYEATTSRLKSVTDSLGQKKTFIYAKDDKPTALTYSNAVNTTPNVSFSYDPWFPRVASMTDGTGATQYQYQAIGQLGALKLSQIDGPYNNDTVSFQYDELRRVVKRNIDSVTETFNYDALGRLIAHNSPLGNFVQTYLGETSQLTGLQDSAGKVGTTWEYDGSQNDRRLLGIQNIGATRSYGYVTTPENRISQISETTTLSGNWAAKDYTFGYDGADRLTSVDVSTGDQYSYDYDSGTNLTGITTPKGSIPISVNGLNQITTVNAQSYTYDANGNVTNDGVRSYVWDAENRLIKVTLNAQSNVDYQFGYDGLGRRISIRSSNGVAAPTVTRYLWCGDSLCQARTSADAVTRRYYPEGEIRTAGNVRLYYARDHLGSVRDAQLMNTGATTSSFDYDAYGKPVQSLARITPDYLFGGMFNLQGVGLYLTNYRAYDPNTGRWLSRDPIGENGGTNLYAYTEGNPINFVDPMGADHKTGKTIDCGGGCTIRIDRNSVGDGRHLHWECRNGGSGSMGEFGGTSHGGTSSDAPQKIKDCARKNGFEPDVLPQSSPNNSQMCGSTCQGVILGVGIGIGCVGVVAICVAQPEACPFVVGAGSKLAY
ncbi:RHS repeat-associated core domain-containing protein [Methylomonas sp. 11b]|uniref:RHS repeat-associated core domain-containing protein n=1 Tax=Methylomonas sp. 11b TaxID=1168169 RepID=UPI00047ACA7B|nr:RHS repeat-associated core domain-containing protein [Methylomonas sp. 11b]